MGSGRGLNYYLIHTARVLPGSSLSPHWVFRKLAAVRASFGSFETLERID
jgi:hypothetical protein